MRLTSRNRALLFGILVLVAGLFQAVRGLFSADDVARSGSPAVPPAQTTPVSPAQAGSATDQTLRSAFDNRRSGVQVQGEGIVTRTLSDDLDGSRHQRFIVRLGSGQTLLISHNIDLAPRIEGLKAGDTVAFYGVYEWSSKGGTVHWTHHDPDGSHVGGWLKRLGRTYQ